MMKTRKIIWMLSAVVTLFLACKKEDDGNTGDENQGNASLSIRMTDAPANYDAVYIDLQSVEFTGSAGSPINLNVNSGIYNLLDFANGMDTLIAFANFPAGTIEQIRLILGNNNSVVVNGVSYPLSTPSAQQSGLKLQVHKTLVGGIAYMLLLDFDASQSIVQEGNGSYSLKPVIRVIDTVIGGSIKGVIVPNVNATITAVNGSNTYSTIADTNGNFLLKGIPTGNYVVTITPVIPFNPVTINNVSVTTGAITDLGIINL